jgi:restriction endonuclease Mrr
LVAPTDLPPDLRDRAVVDLTEDVDAGLRQLVEQIQATSRVDFSAMNPLTFENLVADLLRAVGFAIDEVRHRLDQGVDLRATYQRADPFGSPETEVWLVQAKLYAHSRVSVDAIRQLAGVLAIASGGTRGLLITNAQLTSVALDFLAELERSRVRLRVLDGVELRRLLRQFPAVAARHFGNVAPTSRPGSDGDK